MLKLACPVQRLYKYSSNGHFVLLDASHMTPLDGRVGSGRTVQIESATITGI